LDPNQSHSDNFWAVLDPVAGIMTFFITLIILFIQAKTNWENGLEKKLDITYMYILPVDASEISLVQVHGAYLSGESDVRPWAQSLGSQIMGNMDFDMNWDDPKPAITYDTENKAFYKRYEVIMYLSSNPFEIDKGRDTAHKFLQRSFKYSKVSGDLNNLPIIWSRS